MQILFLQVPPGIGHVEDSVSGSHSVKQGMFPSRWVGVSQGRDELCSVLFSVAFLCKSTVEYYEKVLLYVRFILSDLLVAYNGISDLLCNLHEIKPY